MSEDFSSDSVSHPTDWKMEKKINADMERTEENLTSAETEPSTLPCPGDKAELGEIEEAVSVLNPEQSEMDLVRGKESERSDSGGEVSRTESEREIGGREKSAACEDCMEETQPEQKEKVPHLEIELEELNGMPQKAAGVFSPSLSILRSTSMPEPPRHRSEMWEEENHVFLGHQDTIPDGYYHDYPKQNCEENTFIYFVFVFIFIFTINVLGRHIRIFSILQVLIALNRTGKLM